MTVEPNMPMQSDREVEFVVERDGIFGGFATYIAVNMHEAVEGLSTSMRNMELGDKSNIVHTSRQFDRPITSLQSITPRKVLEGESPSWWNLFIEFPATEVKRGDKISVKFDAEYNHSQPKYGLSARIQRQTGEKEGGGSEVVLSPHSVSW